MSGCPHIAWAFQVSRQYQLLPSVRLVLIALAERANGAKMCWPSLAQVSEDTGYSRRAVQMALDELRCRDDVGQTYNHPPLIEITRKFRATSIYHVLRPDFGEQEMHHSGALDAPLNGAHDAPQEPVKVHELPDKPPVMVQIQPSYGATVAQGIPKESLKEILVPAEKKNQHLNTTTETLFELDVGEKDVCERVRAAWNEAAKEHGLSKAQFLTDKRRTAIKARIKQYTIATVLGAIAKVGQSAFCRGVNDRGWAADFDWLVLQSDVVAKIMEGKYDERRPHITQGQEQRLQW